MMQKFTIIFIFLALLLALAACNEEKSTQQTTNKAQNTVQKVEAKTPVLYPNDPKPSTPKKQKNVVCPYLSNKTAEKVIHHAFTPIDEVYVTQVIKKESGYNYSGCDFNTISLHIYSKEDGDALMQRWRNFKHPSTFVPQIGPGENAVIEYPSLHNKKGLKEPSAIIFYQDGKAIMLHIERLMAYGSVQSLTTAAEEISKNLKKL